MGYIAGIVNKKGDDASDQMLRMLQASSMGPAHAYGIGSSRYAEHYRDAPEFTSLTGPALIGSKNIHVESPEAPMNQGAQSLVFKGLLYDTDGPDGLEVANLIQRDPQKGLEELITSRLGAYSVAVIQDDEISFGLDHVGTIQLYYGENATSRAVATNKKMLWAIGIEPI